MNRFQPFSFGDIGEFLEFIRPEEEVIVEVLRQMIFKNMPGCQEKLAYNVPFYYGNSRVVFLWPGSVPWGGLREEGVQLGFCKGHLMPSRDLLEAGNRKEVFILHVSKKEDLDKDLIKLLLHEAWEIDQLAAKSKRKLL